MVLASVETKKRYEITYRSAPLWKVGEDGALRDLRALNRAAAIGDDHYPEDYEGRITSVLETKKALGPVRTRGFWRSVVKCLDEDQVKLARSKRVKVSGLALVPITDEDTYGAILSEMRRRFSQEQLDAVRCMEPVEFVNLQTGRSILSTDEPERVAKELMRALSLGEVHTAAPLYAVDASGSTTSDTVGAYDENLLLQSEDFGTTWLLAYVTRVLDTDAAPNAQTTADTVTDSNASQIGGIYQGIAVADDGVTRTFSVYLRKTSGATSWPGVQITYLGGVLAKGAVTVNTDTGVLTDRTGNVPDSSAISSVGDYWRVSVSVANNSSGNTTLTAYVFPAAENGTIDGTWQAAAVGSVIVWGAQVEEAASASAYKPTRSSGETSITLQTGGLTDGDHDGEFLNFTIADHDFQIIRNGEDSVLVTADATGEGGAVTALTFAPHVAIQGGIDQCYADQGGTTFTFEVTIATRTGTYTENVDVTTALTPSVTYGLRFTAPDGDLSVVIDGNAANFTMDWNGNVGGADGIEFRNTAWNLEYPSGLFRNCKFVGLWAYHQYSPWTVFHDCTFESLTGVGQGGFINYAFLYGCTIDWSAETASMTYFFGSRGYTIEMEGCTFLGGQHATDKGALWHTGLSTARLANCTFKGLVRLWSSTQVPPAHFVSINCVFDTFSETIFPVKANLNSSPEWVFEANSYYNLIDGIILDAAGAAVTTLAGMQAAGYDTYGKSIDTDPLLNADGTLGAGSPCINAGIGSGVLTDAAGVAAVNVHYPAIGSDFSKDSLDYPSMESRVGTTILRSGVR